MNSEQRAEHYDVVIVGSGVGGSMVAHGLVHAGLKVLMLERGPRVQRTEATWARNAVMELSPYYTMESHYVLRGESRGRRGTFQCIGGPAVFFGGVALRMRECDFEPYPDIVGDSQAEWPYRYADLEPYYAQAEQVMGVAGREASGWLEPPRSTPFPRQAPYVQGPAQRIWQAATDTGLTPSYLPLAIAFESDRPDESACIRCGTCDGYACAIGAKRDPGAAILPDLERRGLEVRPDTVVVRVLRRGGLVTGLECVERTTGRRRIVRADRYVISAGALGSPHLILSSGLQTSSPARDWIGRCLMRHCNGIAYGVFDRPLDGAHEFHKQVGIMDLYGGVDGSPRLGCLQSIHPPPPGLVEDRVPGPLKDLADPLADRTTGLLSIAEDQPQRENRVSASRAETDRFGIPRALVRHRYTRRDLLARHALSKVAREVLDAAGARLTFTVRIKTFSHAVGTLRMGVDPRTSPLDRTSRLRGFDNLWVVDGSFMPRSAGVNPSLTIAANALKAAEHIAERVAADTREATVAGNAHLPMARSLR